MSDDRVKVTVSHGGRERRIPLAVRPALELSDEQVEFAESELMRIVRHVFQVPLECGVDLHDTEGGRIMTGESFRDPSYLPHFPQHWFLTTRAIFGSASTPLPSFTLEEDDELEEKVGGGGRECVTLRSAYVELVNAIGNDSSLAVCCCVSAP